MEVIRIVVVEPVPCSQFLNSPIPQFLSLPLMNFVIRLIISTLAVLVSAHILPGVEVDSFLAAVVVAIVLGALNMFIRPVLIFFSLPAVIFTFGLFLIVINTLIILLAAKLVPGFRVEGFWYAVLFSIVLSLVTGILNAIKKRDEQRF